MKIFSKRVLALFIVGLFTFLLFSKESTNINKTWQYNSRVFIGWNSLLKKEIPIKCVSIKKLKWSDKEKKLSIMVKTDTKIYRDDFVFCFNKGSYYYCGIEDDSGYIKIDKQMNLQIDISFLSSLDSEPLLEFRIKQKEPIKWIPPMENKQSSKKICSVSNVKADREIIFNLLKLYPELTLNKVKQYKPVRYYDGNYGVSIIAPHAWHSITQEGDAILYLLKGKESDIGKYMFRAISKGWSNKEEKEPKKLIKKIANLVTEISAQEANSNGDKITEINGVKLFLKNGNTIGHFVLHRKGKKTRWESYTLIWDGKRLYILSTMTKESELLLGEFLSALGMESFCSNKGGKK